MPSGQRTLAAWGRRGLSGVLMVLAAFGAMAQEELPATEGTNTEDLTAVAEAPGSAEEAPLATEDTAAEAIESDKLRNVNALLGTGAGDTDNGETPDAPAGGTLSRNENFDQVVQMLAGLCLVCALILFLGYAARRMLRKTPLLAGQQYGTVAGRVYLSPRASLHYVRTGGRMLVVGVTQQSVTLVSEFPAEAFDENEVEEPAGERFLEELRKSTTAREAAPEDRARGEADDALASLRGDLQRLQHYLKEQPGDPHV